MILLGFAIVLAKLKVNAIVISIKITVIRKFNRTGIKFFKITACSNYHQWDISAKIISRFL